MAALAFMAGCGPEYLAAAWPDDIALFTAIAFEAQAQRAEEQGNLARRIRNEIAEMTKG